MTRHRRTLDEREVDLLVVGGGVAGLFAALCAASDADVLVLAKGPLRASTSSLAQGGIAAAVGEDDAPSLHAEDTLRTGRGLSRPSAVAALTGEAPARIRDLVPHVIEVPADVAAGFACNAMPVGDTVISSLAASQLESPLERAGFSTVELPMSEFMKSGGGVRCLSLPLDLGA